MIMLSCMIIIQTSFNFLSAFRLSMISRILFHFFLMWMDFGLVVVNKYVYELITD
jgi:hypothetical protein